MDRILKPILSSEGPFQPFTCCTGGASCLKELGMLETWPWKPRSYLITVPFAFWHIPAFHFTTCSCSTPSTIGSIRATIIYSTFDCSTISSYITTAPPNLLCPPDHLLLPLILLAMSATPTTTTSRMSFSTIYPLHLSDHDSVPYLFMVNP